MLNQIYLENMLKDIKELRIALIATYCEMSTNLEEIVDGTKIKLTNIHAHFEEAAKIARSLENKVDIILTRGGTGHFIKQSVSIPVINIPISLFDLLMSINKLPKNIHKVGFSNYARPIFGTEQIEKLCNKEIIQYTFEDLESLKQVVRNALNDGCQTIIGGNSVCKYASEIGIPGVEVVSGKESIFQALISAVEVFLAKNEEQKQSLRLKAAFDSLNEGIVVNDASGKFTTFNSTALQLFHLNKDSIANQTLMTLPLGEYSLEAFEKQDSVLNYLQDVYEKSITTSHFPIFYSKEYIGQVSTFQDVTKIQYLEGKIRKQLNKRSFTAKYDFDSIITQNSDMKSIKEQARLFAQTNFSILIEGESGTGKELFAHSIHNASSRQAGPFVAVNCAAIPEQLLESELFGYAPGAFTGAKKDGKAGLFELAHNGTIFLDEVGEIPKYLQAHLLRVLQEKEVMRIGDNKIIPVDCRIISATNQPLKGMIKEGTFREDLYFRLNILNLKIPPLRERREDIPLLAQYFFTEANLPSYHMENALETISQLKKYNWPGNIRELSNACLRITALSGADEYMNNSPSAQNVDIITDGSNVENVSLNINSSLTLKEAVEEAEEQYIRAILNLSEDNQTLAAKRLGIGRTTLWRRIYNK